MDGGGFVADFMLSPTGHSVRFNVPSLFYCTFFAITQYYKLKSTVLRPSIAVSLSVRLCIVDKPCVLKQKLLSTAYRKSHIGNRLVPK